MLSRSVPQERRADGIQELHIHSPLQGNNNTLPLNANRIESVKIFVVQQVPEQVRRKELKILMDKHSFHVMSDFNEGDGMKSLHINNIF